ncbi:phycobiliprotein lyase [Cyanobium sp. HWJ4-Hawea]|uniref:phycobiliprotein lyase n=1 Tax=Cyanobium sp. HWJ4-Hawea TaxID=2823713 RepID=UPI0020CF9D36|nr:phycobiliprotein lyase [Cyanobium sp. HWJ4-Hawea]MCP9809570.1 phycobiliprotein lyase [Cyanobium sp. HWJ4-Hawea]
MSESPTFPPEEIGAFLRLCAGEWMALNSDFVLGAPDASEDDNSWHSSERGELVVAYLEPESPGEPGGLSMGPKGGLAQKLIFESQGNYRCINPQGGGQGSEEGSWELGTDGGLELVLAGGERRERIWFTKPNLRLRSWVHTPTGGLPSQAYFSSEIRRVSKT